MANAIDPVTGKSAFQIYPPTVTPAKGGWIISQYDIVTDRFTHTIAPSVEVVRDALNEWTADAARRVLAGFEQSMAKVVAD